MKNSILLSLLMGWAFASYGNFSSPEQLMQFCAQNPEAMPSYCSNLQAQAYQPATELQQPMSTTVPAQTSQRAPNLNGLEYRAPSTNSVASYYQIQNQILANQVQQMRWQQQQQMLEKTMNGMRGSFQEYVTREREANESFRTSFMQMQQQFFTNFQSQQTAMFGPYQRSLAETQKTQEFSDDNAVNTEQRNAAEDKVEELTPSQEEIHETLKAHNTSEA